MSTTVGNGGKRSKVAPLTSRRSTVPLRRRGWRAAIFTTDHRTVGLQYFWLSLVAVVIGLALSVLMRFHLVNPFAKVGLLERLWPDSASGGVIKPELYLSLMTMHGTIMVFFVLSIAPQSAFGNYFLPLQIGTRRMAFPLLSSLSFWLTALSFVVLLAAFVIPGGPPLAGWTAYPPLSAVGAVSGPGQGSGQTLWLISIGIFCIAATMGAVSIIATTLDLRRPGLRMMQMPLTCWNWFVTAILSLLGFPVLFAAAILLLLDRSAGTSFFVPANLPSTISQFRITAVRRCYGSTSSGSLAIPRFTLRSCRAWG